uniref:Glycolipid transfer protein domain-containing protein n=1 Tax=Clastoptera arizonana TaxID=38151 RepID=A0A1B6CAC8_9HEMI
MFNETPRASDKSDTIFNLRIVHDSFSSSLLDDNDIDLTLYLEAYTELKKFCFLMGTVFGFVGSEIDSKMEVLIELRRKNDNNHFSSMKKMIQYEIENNLLNDTKYVSGSRTLLRLHRGLDFIRQFLKRVSELQPNDNTNTVGQEVYNNTLAKHHSWLIRKGAHIAMYVLPTKDVLFTRVCGDTINDALEALPSMLNLTNEVYNRTEKLYEEQNLLNLP